jgi:hypothetical protein
LVVSSRYPFLLNTLNVNSRVGKLKACLAQLQSLYAGARFCRLH